MKPCICIGTETQNLKAIYAAGYRHVEIGFAAAALLDKQAYRDFVCRVKDSGLSITAANGFFPSAEKVCTLFGEDFDRSIIRDYVNRAFEQTADLHLTSISFGSGYLRKIPDGFAREKAAERFREIIVTDVVPQLVAHDAYLSVEELQPAETNFLNSCRETAEFVREINHPHVGLLCDFFHMSVAGETPDDVKDFSDVIRHVHIASPSNNRSFPFLHDGDDEKYIAFFKSLENAPHFNGIVSIEGGIDEKDRPYEKAIERSMDMFRAYLPGLDA